MKIRILSARLIAGIHYAEREIVEVAEELGRYLCGAGVAERATSDPKAAPQAAPVSAPKTKAK